MFTDVIDKTMKVYVVDVLVKSLKIMAYVKHLDAAFKILRRYWIRLNPLNCSFGVVSGKFLGYMVN